MAIPDYETLMLPMLKYGNEGVVSFKEAIIKASNDFNLTDEEREEAIPSGSESLIKNRIGWGITYLVKANLLHRPERGHFTITDRGKEILAKDPTIINSKFLEQFPEFMEFRNRKNGKKLPRSQEQAELNLITPEERIGVAYNEITTEIKSELLTKVLESSPEFFEKLILNLLISMGYGGFGMEAGKHLGKSGDGGIDGVINEDKLGLDLIYIQAKRYAPENTIGAPEIQKFVGSLVGKGGNKGVFVTTSSFSIHAYKYIENLTQRIILIDGEKLTSLMLGYNVGVRVNQIIKLKRIDEDFFMDL